MKLIQTASQPIMMNSYLQNTLNQEGTLEISFGKGFYQALFLWNVLCQNSNHHNLHHHHLNQCRNRIGIRNSILDVVNIHGELHSVDTRYFTIPTFATYY